VNPASGGGTAERVSLVDVARERGIETVVFTHDDDLGALVRAAVARGADALGVAGGDGSLAEVAAIAASQGLPFACVPAGTRNHFALDLGLDRHDPLGALGAFTDPLERRIDLGEVNGRTFLNNVSLGVYGDAVRRPTYRDAKLRTLLASAEEVLGPGGEIAGVAIVDDLGLEHADPVAIIVSNNPYAFEPPNRIGGRPALDGGRLGVVVIDRPRPDRPPPARAWTAGHLEIHAAGPVHAGLDGEAIDLTPPLAFEIRPSALRVRIPAATLADRRAGRG
jgi:diacylglycerol kinase family enzyme